MFPWQKSRSEIEFLQFYSNTSITVELWQLKLIYMNLHLYLHPLKENTVWGFQISYFHKISSFATNPFCCHRTYCLVLYYEKLLFVKKLGHFSSIWYHQGVIYNHGGHVKKSPKYRTEGNFPQATQFLHLSLQISI